MREDRLFGRYAASGWSRVCMHLIAGQDGEGKKWQVEQEQEQEQERGEEREVKNRSGLP